MTVRTLHEKRSLAHFLAGYIGAAYYESMAACLGAGFDLARTGSVLIHGQIEMDIH
jgi:hypothetical protein